MTIDSKKPLGSENFGVSGIQKADGSIEVRSIDFIHVPEERGRAVVITSCDLDENYTCRRCGLTAVVFGSRLPQCAIHVPLRDARRKT